MTRLNAPFPKVNFILFLIILLCNTSLYASESFFESNLFKDTNLTAHCHNIKATWDLPASHHYPYEANRVVWIEAETTRTILEALVPKPLKINDDNSIIIYIGKFNITQPSKDSYHESGILIPVTYKDSNTGDLKKSFFVSIMHLDKNLPIIGGRVIYGANKYSAEISITENENTISASVTNSGTTLIDMTVTLKNKVIDTVTDYNNDGWIAAKCKKTENIEYAKFDTLNLADVNNFKIHKFYSGEGKIKLGSNKLNPLGNILLLKIKNAAFQIDSWILGDSLIIHNYTPY